MDMYPTGRLVYVRRLKRLAGWKRRQPRWHILWDAVWIDPEHIVKEARPCVCFCRISNVLSCWWRTQAISWKRRDGPGWHSLMWAT